MDVNKFNMLKETERAIRLDIPMEEYMKLDSDEAEALTVSKVREGLNIIIDTLSKETLASICVITITQNLDKGRMEVKVTVDLDDWI